MWLRAFCIVVALGLLAACARRGSEAAPGPAPAPVRVQVVAVQREVAPSRIEVPGTVRPVERAAIAAKVSGTIVALPVALGQSVKRGELLVRLSAPELSARLAQARAQLDQAEREEKRDRELAAAGADSAEAARAAAERLRVARATVAEAEAMHAYTEITAPYDGRIAQKLVYAGALATPGQALLELESSSALQVEVAVPASLAGSLAPGTELPVQIAGGATPMAARIAEIAAAADAGTHTVLVKLALASTDAGLSGRVARVALAGPEVERLLVPASAVVLFGQMERVFVVRDGKAHLRLVKTGAANGDRVELLSGAVAGESLVVAPPSALRDGQPVTIAP